MANYMQWIKYVPQLITTLRKTYIHMYIFIFYVHMCTCFNSHVAGKPDFHHRNFNSQSENENYVGSNHGNKVIEVQERVHVYKNK